MKRGLIDREDPALTVIRQCELLELPRATLYYKPCQESPRNLEIMRLLDEIYTEHPYYGTRRMVVALKHRGYEDVGRDLVRTLMQRMGLEAVYAKPNLSRSNPEHKIYPYLLRGMKIDRIDQVWSTDITYVRLRNGFMLSLIHI